MCSEMECFYEDQGYASGGPAKRTFCRVYECKSCRFGVNSHPHRNTGESRDEGELEWIDRKKLCDLTLWEGDKIFLRLLENDDEPFFLLKLGYDGDELVSAVLNGTKIV